MIKNIFLSLSSLVLSFSFAFAELPLFKASDLTPYWPSEKLRQKAERPLIIPAFKLIDQDEKSVTDKDLTGKLSVINFFFAQCQDACPLMMEKLRKLQNKTSRNEKVEFFSLSVTPEQDSPKVLKLYAKDHHLDLNHWKLLTGDHTEIYKIGKSVFQKNESSIIHSDNFYLFDGKRQLRGIYTSSSKEQMNNLEKDISDLQTK